MDRSPRLLLAALIVLAAAVGGARGNALVSGSVFCDHCRDGKISLFDYPLAGISVTLSCTDKDGKVTMSKELTTNILGSYSIMFEGTPDLTGCQVQIKASQDGPNGGCTTAPGPARSLQLSMQLFDFSTYFVDSLFSSPAKVPSFCPNSKSSPNPVPTPNPRRSALPPPPVQALPPPVKLPPRTNHPTLPFLDASACPHTMWMKPEYRCHWKLVNPDSKVALVFGLVAAAKYGSDMTLSRALQGRGELYRTLLREATTALLNSYSSIRFPYHPGSVFLEMNFALAGSKRHALLTALRFMRANSGYGKVPCRFTACK